MDSGVMIWLILVGLCLSHIHGLLKCSFCKAIPRRSKSKVLDMDFLMDFHYPMAFEQSEEIAHRSRPLSDHFDIVPAYLSNPTTEHPNIMDDIVNAERPFGPFPLRSKGLPSLGKFIRTHDEKMKPHLLLTKTRKIRQADQKQPLNNQDRRESFTDFDSNEMPNLTRTGHRLKKRFFVSRNLHHRPKSRKFKVDQFGNISWTQWHSNSHIANMTKRDTGSRRLKLSDILARAGFRKDKEEAIKVVLPLLLSDLRETSKNITNPVAAPNTENIRIPVISSSSGKQGRQMRNFKVKGDDGKEFSFSASASDVKQLLDILAKPNSSVVLERVSLDKNRLSGINKTNQIIQKAKVDAKTPDDGANNTESVPQLKEFENSVYESILQMDVPNMLSKSTTTTASPDTTKSSEATTSSDTTGS